MTVPVADRLRACLRDRIVVIDGAMGTMIQRLGLAEEDFRGTRFRDHPMALRGCNDLLCLTQPEAIAQIHDAYLDAGAEIIETNTFNATSVSMRDYGMEPWVAEINRAAARLAREAADRAMARAPARPRFVAGSLGPTTVTASLSPDVDNPAARAIGFDALRDAYYEAARGLIEGGADLLLPETATDTLNLKAALFAIEACFRDLGVRLPVIASMTIVDNSGRTLSGQTVEAFYASVEHARLFAISMNCALGPAQMRPFLEDLCTVSSLPVLCFPNAGLPNEMGGYDLGPDGMAAAVAEFADAGLLNMTGGCCGTTPDHIRAIAEAVRGRAPRTPPSPPRLPRWAGLETYAVYPGTTFTMVGERTNVTGSRRFRTLIERGDYEAAVQVARGQVEGGANILDVNMDEGMLDSALAMTTFLNHIGSEPDIARIPVMVDSSRFDVIEAGLRCLQGKSIVNSISLKEGEDTFVRQAELCRAYGASVIVMAFDEQGQATDTEARVAICVRAYRILTEQVGFRPEDIIFDPNVLAIGTGIEEHAGYAVSFIEAARLIKEQCPGALISGGISNLSFAFRGNDRIREAIHAVFLYHAIAAGLDMGIVNAGQLAVYEEIPPDLLERVEDLVLNRRPDATERLLEHAQSLQSRGRVEATRLAWREAPLDKRIEHALLAGNSDWVQQDMDEALRVYPSALSIIEGPLMAGMSVVGDLFGAGKMFLPQVVKSARVMKRAVAVLEPFMEQGEAASHGTVVLATVKGDVHDIGKNIVGVVLRCNGYEVVDLGVMVPADRILETARTLGAVVVGLSGLITPSLDEMVHVAREMTRQGPHVPLLIGGATTSRKHTAVKIAPAYSGPTLHVQDASRAAGVLGGLTSPDRQGALLAENARDQARTRVRWEAEQSAIPLVPLEEARARRGSVDWAAEDIPVPPALGVVALEPPTLSELAELIDWGPFFHAWELRGSWRERMEDPEVGPRYRELLDDAWATLRQLEGRIVLSGVYGHFPAGADGEDLVVFQDDTRQRERCRFHMLRQQEVRKGRGGYLSLADLVAPLSAGRPDYVGAFAVTAGLGADAAVAEHEAAHDDYGAIMVKAVCDRLAEALAERVHQILRERWGFAETSTVDDLHRGRYRGIRPAPGYPACPDHTEKATLFGLLEAERRAGIRLTESFAMLPAASVSALVFGSERAKYFSLGRIGRDQVVHYARRKGLPVPEVERWLGPNLGYDPSAP